LPHTTAFILANTKLLRPPLVPEIQLHLAEESMPIWHKTEEELGELNVPPPYWAFAWAGGQALARHVLDNPEMVAGKTVLDIGSGSGLVAIAAKLASAQRVIANDIDAFAIEACKLNAGANAVELEINGDNIMQSADGIAPEHPDVIFFGDVFYEEDLARNVLSFAKAQQRRGPHILVGDPSRSYFPPERFHRIIEYAVPVTRELEDYEIKRSGVWAFSG
jgi:predicted nicotinamide N-methyase